MQINQKFIIDSWQNSKFSSRNFYKLEESITIEYEYRTRFGHPSTYAFVQFNCEPSEKLMFKSTAIWNEDLHSGYVELLEKAICEAIVDSLISASMHPYRGCALNLISIKWDDISSSEFSFYKATKIVLEELIKNGKWKFESVYLKENQQNNL